MKITNKKNFIISLILTLAMVLGLAWCVWMDCVEVQAIPVSEAVYVEGSLEFYENMVDNLDIIHVVDSSDLTFDMLESRAENGTILIEKCIGKVENDNLDGKILNVGEAWNSYDYISYRCLEGQVREGSVVLTYFVYNPDSNYTDDIVDRFDYVLDY